jgi:hypothetical protein
MFFDVGKKKNKDKLANWCTAMDENKKVISEDQQHITVLAHFNLPKKKTII